MWRRQGVWSLRLPFNLGGGLSLLLLIWLKSLLGLDNKRIQPYSFYWITCFGSPEPTCKKSGSPEAARLEWSHAEIAQRYSQVSEEPWVTPWGPLRVIPSRADTKCPSSHSRRISELKFAFALSHNILGACYAVRDNQSSQHTNTGGPQSVLKEGSTPEHPEAKLLITGPRLSPECPVISSGP